jgi:hypothetical protein
MQPITSALMLSAFQQHEAWLQIPEGFATAKNTKIGGNYYGWFRQISPKKQRINQLLGRYLLSGSAELV